MFPFALIDDAAQQIEKAADAVIAATEAIAFESVKFPISMDVPDRVLTNTIRDTDGIKFAADEYAFKQQTSDNDVSLECWSGQFLAQKFITDTEKGNTVRKITLTLNRIGGTSGQLTVSIYADNSGVPASSALGNSNTVAINTISAKGNVTFTFGTELALVKNTVYWIVLTSTGDSSNKVVWYCKTASPDPAYPAAVKVGAGSWTINSDKNMTYILIGYYTTASAELPVKLAVGPEYQAAYFAATTDANSSITIDIKNADTGETLYANLTDGQAVALNPSNTPNLKIIVNLTRNPGQTLTLPVLGAVGFSGRAYQSKYSFIDRDFRPTAYSKHVVGSMGLVRTSGGLKLVSSIGTLKANSEEGYVDNSGGSYRVASSGDKATQLYYTNAAVTITGFRIRVKGSSGYHFAGGVWLDNAGAPGALQGSLKNSDTLGTTDGVWKTITFDTPVGIPANTYFHVGIQLASGTIYVSNYATPFEGLHVTAGAGVIYRTVSWAMDLYGKCASALVTSELILPGVKEHGLVYPLAYLPAGAGVTMAISDPLTGMPFHTLGTGEKCSLALLPTELFNRIKLVTTLTQNLDSPGPVIGLCYTYTGSEMAPEPVKRYKIMTYTFGALGAAGNYLTINGRGKVLAMSISGSTAASSYGDGHKLVLDNLNTTYYRFYNVTSKTWACLFINFNWAVGITSIENVGQCLNFEFNEKLSWDLTEYYGAQNGGSITVALEV